MVKGRRPKNKPGCNVKQGDLILLVSPKGKRYLRRFDPEIVLHTQEGMIRFSEVARAGSGGAVATHLDRWRGTLGPLSRLRWRTPVLRDSVQRLTLANLRNEVAPIHEVLNLIEPLADSWKQIRAGALQGA